MTDGTDGAGRVFGIDLGTTYSAIAYLDESGRPTVCRNETGTETTPSVVHFETPTNVVVGQTAKDFAVIDPDNVVSLIKRRMGQQYEVEFHGQRHTPESISAFILRKLAEDAQTYTDSPVTSAVITVPAYFGREEKEATKNAGVIAGLDVVGILPEPVAAAVHYDVVSGGGEKTVLVYDLGGGTFDTTVIQVGATDITVVCTDGATDLGGADWDVRLGEHVLARFAEETGLEVPDDDSEFLQQLTSKTEDVKKQLTSKESRPIVLQFEGRSIRVEVTRSEFEAMTADLLDRTVEIVRRTLVMLEEKAPGTVIDDVLLVGGSTKMPMVMERLVKEFGWNPKLHDPDLAVAKGAALFALSRVVWRLKQEALASSDDAEVGEQKAVDMVKKVAQQYGLTEKVVEQLTAKRHHSALSRAFGVKLQRSVEDETLYVKHLAFANDTLPTGDRTLPVNTLYHDQDTVEIELYEQAGQIASDVLSANKPLTDGAGLITGIPLQPPGQFATIDIVLSIDEDGLLVLHATERSSGRELTIRVTIGKSEAEIESARNLSNMITVSS